jgi:hypothetical protein
MIKEGPCRNRGRLPKLTAYEKIENLNFIVTSSISKPVPKVKLIMLRNF